MGSQVNYSIAKACRPLWFTASIRGASLFVNGYEYRLTVSWWHFGGKSMWRWPRLPVCTGILVSKLDHKLRNGWVVWWKALYSPTHG